MGELTEAKGDLVCASFPRSANTFTHVCMYFAFPEYNIHRIHQVFQIQRRDNVITVIRSPHECVASLKDALPDVFHGDPDKPFNYDDNLRWYSKFMSATLDNLDKVYAVPYERMIINPFQCMKEYADRFSLGPVVEFDPADALTTTPDRNAPRRPDANPAQYYDAVRAGAEYNNALELYSEVISRLTAQSVSE